MPELFSLVVPSIVSGAVGWATKAFLNSLAGCPSCGRDHSASITNHATNRIVCAYCTNSLGQYNVMTPTTVSRTGQVMGANIFNPHFEGQKEGFIFKRHARNWFLLDVSTVGMHNHAMVIRGGFRDLKSGRKWKVEEKYLNNPYERTVYNRVAWNLESIVFPAGSPILAEFSVHNLDGDTLHAVAPVETFVLTR